MEIIYLKSLRDNPDGQSGNPDFEKINIPISLKEIVSLELQYNQEIPFPATLRELLFLAGHYCYFLDNWGISQQAMQEFVREQLTKVNRQITRPFYAIDLYNGYDQFLYVHLDEGDNPMVYEAVYDEDITEWTYQTGLKLAEYSDAMVKRVLSGRNPF